MDALEVGFSGRFSFDFVMAFHVVSVVPNANRLMDEARRVCRPRRQAGDHQSFPKPAPVGALVWSIWSIPIARRLGWRTTLGINEVARTVPMSRSSSSYKTNPRSLFTVLVARNEKELAAVG